MKRVLSLLALSLTSACSDEAPADAPPQGDWASLAELSFETDGETPWLAVPDAADHVALRASAADGACFELSAATTGDGQVLAQRFSGQACSDCTLRSAVAFEAGVFVVPRESQVRFGVVDCETLNPLKRPQGSLQVDIQPLADSTPASIALRLIVAPDSTLSTDADARDRLLDALGAELSGSRITPRVAGVERLAEPAGRLRFHVGDPTELAKVLAEHPAEPREVRVVVAGCLEYADPLFGPPIAVDGYTPRVLGGAGPADAVFLPDLDCTSSLPLSATPEARGRTLAHELGHYLGLFHTDPESDEASNLMNPNPALASARGLTPEQIAVMRRHPSLE